MRPLPLLPTALLWIAFVLLAVDARAQVSPTVETPKTSASTPAPASEPQPRSVESFKATDLQGFIDDVQALRRDIADVRHASISDLAKRVPAGWRVRHAGDEVAMSSGWIGDALEHGAEVDAAHWQSERPDVLAETDAVLAEAEALRQAAAPPAAERAGERALDRDRARAALKDILGRKEFERRAEDWRTVVGRWIGSRLENFFRRFDANGVVGGVGTTLAWLASGAALVALVMWLLRARIARRAPQPMAFDGVRPTSREWADRARAALRTGDAREAIRCAYHAALFRFEEQGVWRVDDARTPREYLSLVPAQDVRRTALADLTRAFEQTWYGSRPADGRDVLERLEVICPARSEQATSAS